MYLPPLEMVSLTFPQKKTPQLVANKQQPHRALAKTPPVAPWPFGRPPQQVVITGFSPLNGRGHTWGGFTVTWAPSLHNWWENAHLFLWFSL